MKLTPFSRLLIVLAVVAGAYFGFRYLTQQQGVASPEEQTSTADKPAENTATTTVSAPVFNYQPPAPVNGTLKGIVELGASGFNSFIVNADNQKRWELKKAEYGASLVYENMATEQDVRDGLKRYIATMLDFGVSPKNIHFMVSSSAIKAPEVVKIRAALKSLGYVVNAVNAEQEGKLAYQAAMTMDYQNTGFVVDIGSGNTKVSWMANGQVKSLETYGSKYYQNNVSDKTVANEVAAVAAQVPAANRQVCFIIGGAPFELAKQTRKGKERYTPLLAPGDYKADSEKVKAGVNIYQALRENTGCDTFVFDWDANFTIGFLLGLN